MSAAHGRAALVMHIAFLERMARHVDANPIFMTESIAFREFLAEHDALAKDATRLTQLEKCAIRLESALERIADIANNLENYVIADEAESALTEYHEERMTAMTAAFVTGQPAFPTTEPTGDTG